VDRHLLPAEIDLLLDGEIGFGTTPLKAHVRRCQECRAELESARSLVRTLEHLPHYAPAPAFAQHVMARVQLYVPWYVALLDFLRRFVPSSRPARLAVGSLALTMFALITVASVWMVTRLDALVFAVDLGLLRIREWGSAAIAAAISSAFGEPVVSVLQAAGWLGMTAALLFLFLSAAGAATLVRGLVRARGR
jgi:hypothetical protein